MNVLNYKVRIISHLLVEEIIIISNGISYDMMYVGSKVIIYTASKEAMEVFIDGMIQMFIERG